MKISKTEIWVPPGTPVWIQKTPDSCVSGRVLIALKFLRQNIQKQKVIVVQVHAKTSIFCQISEIPEHLAENTYPTSDLPVCYTYPTPYASEN